MGRTTNGSVPVLVAAKVYGKDPSWIRTGIIEGWLPIGTATRRGKKVTSKDDMDAKLGRINYYISPQLLYEETGFKWKGDDDQVRSELSENSKWHLNRHRFLELKHFCMQYPEWDKYYRIIGIQKTVPIDEMIFYGKGNLPSDPTARAAIAKTEYKYRMELVKETADDACGDLSRFIFEGVTRGLSYEELEGKFGRIPCSRDTYYDNYRKFFALLHIRRG